MYLKVVTGFGSFEVYENVFKVRFTVGQPCFATVEQVRKAKEDSCCIEEFNAALLDVISGAETVMPDFEFKSRVIYDSQALSLVKMNFNAISFLKDNEEMIIITQRPAFLCHDNGTTIEIIK